MKTLTAYLIDDEYHALQVLTEYVQRTPGLKLTGSTTRPLLALQELTGFPPPDIILLDVDMPDINGLDLADLLPPTSKIVFTTSFREYAVEAFEKQAADYLLKPISYERFLKAIQQLRFQSTLAPPASLLPLQDFFVKTELKGKLQRVQLHEILYIEALQHYVHFHLYSGKVIIAPLPISEVEAALPSGQFSRIHKSFIVNHEFIHILEGHQVRLTNQKSLPIGRSYQGAFQLKIEPLFFIAKRDKDR